MKSSIEDTVIDIVINCQSFLGLGNLHAQLVNCSSDRKWYRGAYYININMKKIVKLEMFLEIIKKSGKYERKTEI